jgi:hypothetical protein
MDCEILRWGREVPGRKEMQVLEGQRQSGEKKRREEAMRKTEGIFVSAAGDVRAGS